MMEHLERLRKPLLAAPLIIEFVVFNSTFTSMAARMQRRILTRATLFCSTIIVSKYAIAKTNSRVTVLSCAKTWMVLSVWKTQPMSKLRRIASLEKQCPVNLKQSLKEKSKGYATSFKYCYSAQVKWFTLVFVVFLINVVKGDSHTYLRKEHPNWKLMMINDYFHLKMFDISYHSQLDERHVWRDGGRGEMLWVNLYDAPTKSKHLKHWLDPPR